MHADNSAAYRSSYIPSNLSTRGLLEIPASFPKNIIPERKRERDKVALEEGPSSPRHVPRLSPRPWKFLSIPLTHMQTRPLTRDWLIQLEESDVGYGRVINITGADAAVADLVFFAPFGRMILYLVYDGYMARGVSRVFWMCRAGQ